MIWKKYFYSEIFKTFAFLLFGFFALYITIDLMAHLKDLRSGSTSFMVWITYYLCTFSRRLDVLVPFALLIGTIRILLGLQARNELVALLVSGVPMKTLLQPFIVAAASASLLLYVNFELFLPFAQPKALSIQENDFGKKVQDESEAHVQELILHDASRLFYSSYNPILRQFRDVFWIVNIDKVYHIKTLNCLHECPRGFNVDLITRDASGKMQKEKSFSEVAFNTMLFDEESFKQSIQQPKDQSISTLWHQVNLYNESTSDRAIDLRSWLLYKLTFPLICLFASLAPIAYCISFRRDLPYFMIYLLSLSALFCFFLLLQVALVLAKSHIVSPAIALGLPWILAVAATGKNFMCVMNGKT
ncbi:MAG: LptF/LptG family permease [Verrucomicrobia bacterium]|nr:LptF/LptG family permease [Verrucomicrobiota bacterium]